MVDETGSGELAARQSFYATSAAFSSYWSVYGDTFRGDSPALLDALYEFWLARFRKGHPFPSGLFPAQDEQAPAASEAPASSPGTS